MVTDERSAGPGDWRPANAVERAMAEALAEQDGLAYARALRAARLLVPQLPPAGSAAEAALARLLPAGASYRPVFTSPESLARAFDPAPPYEQVGFAALLQRWPDPRLQLAVDPGSPIAMFLPPHAVRELAEGTRPLVATDELLATIRRACLHELAGASVDGAGALRDDPPANRVEVALKEAVARQDVGVYVRALFAADQVVLPTAAPVSDPDRIIDGDFPWRVLGGDRVRAIPVFSSTTMLERTGAGHAPRIEIGMLPVVAAWPGEEFLLYVNPGSTLELMLSGDAVLDLVDLIGE